MKNDFCSDMFLSFVSSDSVSNEARDQLEISRAVGPSDEVAMWINSGPVFDTIIEKVEAKYEGTRYILVSSGNLSGNGTPNRALFLLMQSMMRFSHVSIWWLILLTGVIRNLMKMDVGTALQCSIWIHVRSVELARTWKLPACFITFP